MNLDRTNLTGPHASAQIAIRSYSSDSTSAIILLHGRGATSDNIIGLTDYLKVPEHTAIIAPQATDLQWYPFPFTVDTQQNQPHLESALQLVQSIISTLQTQGIPTDNIILAGFSQGGCLTAQYLFQPGAPKPGAALILSGGLIGTDDQVEALPIPNLSSTLVHLGCDQVDPFIPLARVQQSIQKLQSALAQLDSLIYTDYGHTIHPQQLQTFQSYIDQYLKP